MLVRNLKGRPPVSDLFGKKGKAWLAGLELPVDERHTVQGCLRQLAARIHPTSRRLPQMRSVRGRPPTLPDA